MNFLLLQFHLFCFIKSLEELRLEQQKQLREQRDAHMKAMEELKRAEEEKSRSRKHKYMEDISRSKEELFQKYKNIFKFAS